MTCLAESFVLLHGTLFHKGASTNLSSNEGRNATILLIPLLPHSLLLKLLILSSAKMLFFFHVQKMWKTSFAYHLPFWIPAQAYGRSTRGFKACTGAQVESNDINPHHLHIHTCVYISADPGQARGSAPGNKNFDPSTTRKTATTTTTTTTTTTDHHHHPHHQPTTNHQPPPTTTNHQQPPTTTNNHQQPPTYKPTNLPTTN